MAKRFISTEIWSEDWFLNMPNEYKLFWFYMISNCDHAGIFKVNLRFFCGINEVSLTSKKVLEFFNSDKERILEINTSTWLLADFFVFQYGSVLNLNNKVHNSINNIYKKYNIELKSIRGLVEIKDNLSRGQGSPLVDLKQGVKDIDNKYYLNNNTSTSSNEVTNYNKQKKEKTNFPIFSDFDFLPDANISAIIQRIKITKFMDISREDLLALWQVFRVENLTGKNYYSNAEKVYKHFGEWVKFQKFEKRKPKETNPYKMNGTERAEWWKEQQRGRTQDSEMPPE